MFGVHSDLVPKDTAIFSIQMHRCLWIIKRAKTNNVRAFHSNQEEKVKSVQVLVSNYNHWIDFQFWCAFLSNRPCERKGNITSHVYIERSGSMWK